MLPRRLRGAAAISETMPANTHGGVLRGLGASVAERRKALLLAESVGVPGTYVLTYSSINCKEIKAIEIILYRVYS